MEIAVFWFRRDLRWQDNHGLFQALSSGLSVFPLFIFDKNILDELSDKTDARVTFIHQSLQEMNSQLEDGKGINVFHGTPEKVFEYLTTTYEVKAVFTNHDYEPYAIKRDGKINDLLKSKGIEFHSFKDQVIFEKEEVMKPAGGPYTVFTPYSRRWKEQLTADHLAPFTSEDMLDNLTSFDDYALPSLETLGFTETTIELPSRKIPQRIIKEYDKTRDYPGIAGTSKLGVHLRFGTLSIRMLTKIATKTNGTFLNELIWRNFYMTILWHFPQVVTEAFKPAYDAIPWRKDEEDFKKWCKGETGYPLVDAGMRELNATGYMHNRVRMVVASFLTKHLLIDWRWGEAYFAEKLLDFDLAANNGGWQWAAGSGCDAAPYFRVFNPESQLAKFDKQLTYVKKWVPEYQELSYSAPMVDHKFARERALDTYKKALSSAK